MKNIFKDARGERPEVIRLGAGEHIVNVRQIIGLGDQPMNSFLKADGSMKDNLPDHDDSTPQVLVVFGNKDGVHTHRFNGLGFPKFAELTDEEIKKLKATEGDRGYALVNEMKNGKPTGRKVRLISEEKTAACERIWKGFLYAIGGEGFQIDENTDLSEMPLVIGLKEESYENVDGEEKSNLKLHYTRALKPSEVEALEAQS